jgi:hypothetical protein
MHYYKVYNFTIETPFPISELMEIGHQSVDIRIKEEPISVDIDNVLSTGTFFNGTMQYQITADSILLSIDTIGKFRIINKKTVIIDRLHDVSNEDIALYLLGTCFAYIIMLNGGFALHGSCVKIGNSCIVFTGDSGVGKSTTSARLFEKGYKLLADDVCVITFNNEGVAFVHPAYPQFKLWDNSVEKLGYNKTELQTVSDNWAKFRMSAKSGYYNQELPLSHVFELLPSEIRDLKLETLQGFNKVTLLLTNTYRNFLIPTLNLEKEHFQFCTQLAQQIDIKKIHRPSKQFLLDELIELVETETMQTI